MKRRGVALIMSLAVLVGLLALLGGMAAANRVRIQAERNRLEVARAKLTAESGIQRAVAEIRLADGSFCSLNDHWATLGKGGTVGYRVGYDGFRIQLIDAGCRLNVNSASESQLKHLSLNDEQVASILDWREDKPTSRPGGAKDPYYNSLSDGYNAALKPLQTLDELLLVKGFSAEIVFKSSDGRPALADLMTTESASADCDPTGSTKLDANSMTVSQLVTLGIPQQLATSIVGAKPGQFSSMRQVLSVPGVSKPVAKVLANNVAIGSDRQRAGLININTASEVVLQTVPGVKKDIASAIRGHQAAGFHGLGELLDLPGIDQLAFAQMADSLCVSSRAWIVRVLGMAGRSHFAEEACLVLADDGSVAIVRVQPAAFWDAATGWGWDDDATSEETLLEAS